MIQQSKLKLEEKLVQFAKDNSKEKRKEKNQRNRLYVEENTQWFCKIRSKGSSGKNLS
jgi:hypothetical protein